MQPRSGGRTGFRGGSCDGPTKAGGMEGTEQPTPPTAGPGEFGQPPAGHDYPLTFAVDYPDRELNRLSTAFRIFTIIPIAILAGTLEP